MKVSEEEENANIFQCLLPELSTYFKKTQTSLKLKVRTVHKVYSYPCEPDTQLYWKQLSLQLQFLSFF